MGSCMVCSHLEFLLICCICLHVFRFMANTRIESALVPTVECSGWLGVVLFFCREEGKIPTTALLFAGRASVFEVDLARSYLFVVYLVNLALFIFFVGSCSHVTSWWFEVGWGMRGTKSHEAHILFYLIPLPLAP